MIPSPVEEPRENFIWKAWVWLVHNNYLLRNSTLSYSDKSSDVRKEIILNQLSRQDRFIGNEDAYLFLQSGGVTSQRATWSVATAPVSFTSISVTGTTTVTTGQTNWAVSTELDIFKVMMIDCVDNGYIERE